MEGMTDKNGSYRRFAVKGVKHSVKFGGLWKWDEGFGSIREDTEGFGVNWNVSVFAPRASTTSRK